MSVKVVVSRYWKKPNIEVTFSEHGVVLEMTIEDFLLGVAAEMIAATPKVEAPPPRKWWQREKPIPAPDMPPLEDQLFSAASAVLQKVKRASVHA